MPIYDYACDACSIEFDAIKRIDERHTATCPKCGEVGRQILKANSGAGLSQFKAGWWTEIQHDPIYVNTPQELRDACDRNNSYSDYLENSIHKTKRDRYEREHL